MGQGWHTVTFDEIENVTNVKIQPLETQGAFSTLLSSLTVSSLPAVAFIPSIGRSLADSFPPEALKVRMIQAKRISLQKERL